MTTEYKLSLVITHIVPPTEDYKYERGNTVAEFAIHSDYVESIFAIYNAALAAYVKEKVGEG